MDTRPWYKKKRYVIPSAVLAFVLLGSAAIGNQTGQDNYVTPAETASPENAAPVAQTVQSQDNAYVRTDTTSATNTDNSLSNNNYYTNVDGNQVHSPADTENGSVPEGATAECNDGTYSFSQHHSGTCSHHGGVASWIQ